MIDTTYYKLHKPAENDTYDITKQNENMDAIDSALRGLETGKETPAAAQDKADQAKAAAVAACRPVNWMPSAKEVGAPDLIDGKIKIGQIPILPPVVTTAGTGSLYTATIDGIAELSKGLTITIIPHTVSTVSIPSLNLNGLGSKSIKIRINNSQTTGTSKNSNWILAGKPQILQYDGTCWVAVGVTKTDSQDISGIIPISSGGTGKSGWTANRLIYPTSSSTLSQLSPPTSGTGYLTQGTSGAPYWSGKESMCGTIGAVPTSRTINGKPLTSNIVLTAGDVEATEKIEAPTKDACVLCRDTEGPYYWTSINEISGTFDTKITINGESSQNIYFKERGSKEGYCQIARNSRGRFAIENIITKRDDQGAAVTSGTINLTIGNLSAETDKTWEKPDLITVYVSEGIKSDTYKLYGEHNVTVSETIPTDFIGEGCIVFCTADHKIYRGINGSNVAF
ncbi:hypothetical protein [Anaeromassilibacillus senegalensis]|uniref:hypothetical protein n=1 Tax=Anaeromassilibacillus senegalensis TaxID=1673717 RepID=UPI00067FCCA1|nr:hypothetical protein [Anaeromassilibacillus senegalensis]